MPLLSSEPTDEAKVVRFTLSAADLAFYGLQDRAVVEPGTFDLWIAPSAESEGIHGTFELVA